MRAQAWWKLARAVLQINCVLYAVSCVRERGLHTQNNSLTECNMHFMFEIKGSSLCVCVCVCARVRAYMCYSHDPKVLSDLLLMSCSSKRPYRDRTVCPAKKIFS